MSWKWLWWSTIILLLLRLGEHPVFALDDDSIEEESTSEEELISTTTVSTTTEKKGPKSADELGVPRCTHNYQCVRNGVCIKDQDDYGRCLCPRSCTPTIPVECKGRSITETLPCLVLGDSYSSKYALSPPTCHKARCVCPPMFEVGTLSPSQARYPPETILPVKCDRRQLQVVGVASPSSVYKGSNVKLFCCINIDPANHIDANAVFFIHNETISRDPTTHPFQENHNEAQLLSKPSCWTLEINNVQLSDSGSYMCLVTPSGNYPSVNYTMNFEVKEHEKRHHPWFKRTKKLLHQANYLPRMIKNLRTVPTDKSVNVTWDIQEGPHLKIDLQLLRRTDLNGKVVWSQENAISPVYIDSLRAATPYTLKVTVKDGQVEPFDLSEHFTTADALPDRPKYVGVRVGYNSGPFSSGSSLNCEVEWRAPSTTNGNIVNYYVRVQGELRRAKSDGSLVPSDYPPAVDKKCANWDEREPAAHGINPIDFSNDLLFCKFGPLKPNRNYTVTVWAENGAGKSSPITFPKQCVTQYAQPDVVEKPKSSVGTNQTSFPLTFDAKSDDTNGPISCYYIAVVPLPANVSLDSLPSPQEIVMDTFAKAFANNLQPPSDRKVYFAYIAESYRILPSSTVIGDGSHVEGLQPCSVFYLSRHPAEDSALRPGLKYTGFLIVRVDNSKPHSSSSRLRSKTHGRVFRSIDYTSRMMDPFSSGRSLRQLPPPFKGPVYGYSQYFKPVFLQAENGGSVLGTVFKIIGPMLLFFVMVSVLVLLFMQRRGIVPSWCPFLTISKETVDRIPLKPTNFPPIPVEDLPSEYLIRHRDSDFMFNQEFESLPKLNMSVTASMKKENRDKNRYNDIQAYDETRVVLKKINNVETSDYINANFVNGWNGRKKFIAAQAPMDKTVNDFWRMIWEQDCRLIVMVANLTEKGRQQVFKYWPDDEPIRYGDLLVTPVSSNYNAYYTVRSLDVANLGATRLSPSHRSEFGGSAESNLGSEYANVPSSRPNGRVSSSLYGDAPVRRIEQYHFTNWNDYSAPECTTGLLRFLHRLRGLNEFTESPSPVVIHCSAGVGRTGTFVTIDSMLDQCEAESKADIFGFVVNLRRQRNLMVQTVEQYVFIYKALAEWHLFGHTDMDVERFKEHYQQLVDPLIRVRSNSLSGATRVVVRGDSHTSLNGMEAEFKKLQQTLETPAQISFATKDENIMKNRFEAAVPYDRTRVVLAPMIGYADSSYINASQIKGYFYPYILAQDPVSESTVFDFWRMISEKQVTTLVMLSPEEDWSPSEKYWPEELKRVTVVKRGPLSVNVILTDEDRYPYYVVRKMMYQNVNHGTKEWHSVTQFSMKDWPSDRIVPEKTDSLLSLIGRVLETQSKLPESGPIVLHCRNGSSQTGVFCCVSLLLERWRAEQRVDVFQTVKGLQTQRPMLFSNLEEYQFCYKAVLDYIRSSGISS